MGVWIDNKLDSDKHILTKVKTANGIIALTKNCFCNITMEIFSNIYKSVIRPHLEYVNLIENVQRRATKLVSQLRELDYESRLRVLNLPTLAYRRKRGTIIEMYKLTNQFYDSNASDRLFEPIAIIYRGNQNNLMSKADGTASLCDRLKT